MSGGSNNYWPGFVDVLLNVVLNVTFLLSIFILGVFVVSTTGTIGEDKSKTFPPKFFKEVFLIESSETSEVRPVKAKNFSILSIRKFSTGMLYVVQASPTSAEKPFNEILKNISTANGKIYIWSEVDVESSYQTKTAYLQNVELTKKMMDGGVLSERIETRIINSLTPYQGSIYIFIENT